MKPSKKNRHRQLLSKEDVAAHPATSRNVIKESIPVKSIVLLEGTSPRLELNQDQVETFKSLFSDSDKGTATVPPIEVELIQTGNPRDKIYALIDGLHRHTAAKQVKLTTILAHVNSDKGISKNEMDSLRAQRELRLDAVKTNAKNATSFTLEEKKNNVIELTKMGCTIEQIAETGIATFRQVREWAQLARDMRKVDKKREFLKLHKEGTLSNRQMADTLGVDEWTIRRWKKELEKTSGSAGFKTNGKKPAPKPMWGPDMEGEGETAGKDDTPAPKEPEPTHAKDNGNGTHKPEDKKKDDELARQALEAKKTRETVDEIIRHFSVAYELMRKMKESPEVDEQITQVLIPLMRIKFPSVAALIKDGGYIKKTEELIAKNHHLEHTIAKERTELAKLRQELETANDELKTTRRHCDTDCKYLRAKFKEHYVQYMDFISTTIQQHLEALGEISKENRPLLENLTMEIVISFLSAVEWGNQNAVSTNDTPAKFEQLCNMITSSGLLKIRPSNDDGNGKKGPKDTISTRVWKIRDFFRTFHKTATRTAATAGARN